MIRTPDFLLFTLKILVYALLSNLLALTRIDPFSEIHISIFCQKKNILTAIKLNLNVHKAKINTKSFICYQIQKSEYILDNTHKKKS